MNSDISHFSLGFLELNFEEIWKDLNLNLV